MAFSSMVIIPLFYLVTSSVADNTDKPATENRDIAKEFDNLKNMFQQNLKLFKWMRESVTILN
jgi:ABC-type maltose transport system permease subunit